MNILLTTAMQVNCNNSNRSIRCLIYADQVYNVFVIIYIKHFSMNTFAQFP